MFRSAIFWFVNFFLHILTLSNMISSSLCWWYGKLVCIVCNFCLKREEFALNMKKRALYFETNLFSYFEPYFQKRGAYLMVFWGKNEILDQYIIHIQDWESFLSLALKLLWLLSLLCGECFYIIVALCCITVHFPSSKWQNHVFASHLIFFFATWFIFSLTTTTVHWKHQELFRIKKLIARKNRLKEKDFQSLHKITS